MKQAKKLLCMLLVMLLAFSTVSIGVSAAWTDYKSAPASWDLHENAVLSTPQRASQLLDFLDETLGEMRDDLYIDAVVLKIDITSVDNALNTIDSIKGATGLIGGDVNDLNFDALDSTRRTTAGKTDLHILYNLIRFLYDNRGIVGRFLKGDLDLGIIGSFVELDFNVYTLLMDMLYESLVDENAEAAPAGWTADSILQHTVNTFLIGGTTADGEVQEAILPSMQGKTDIHSYSIWQIIENAANAATKDIIVPFIENDLGGYIADLKEQYPLDAWRLVNIDNFSMDGYVWGQFDKTNGILAEVNHFLYFVLDQIWQGDPFWQDGGNDKLQSNLEALLKILYKELGTAILPASSEFLPVEEVNAMNLQELVVYVAKQFISTEMEYVLWEDSWGEELPLENIGQLACYVAYSFAADILPTNYIYQIEDGQKEAGMDLALEILADIGAYYLNAIIPIDAPYGQGYEALLRRIVNWALADNNFGGFFKGCGVSDSDTVWKKIDKTVLTVLPLQQIFGGNVTGSEDLIKNRIIGSITNLDLENLLELFYKSPSSVLNKTVSEFVIWLVNGVLNVIIASNTQPNMISTSLKTVDAVIQNANLAGLAERLLAGLYQSARYQYFWDSLLPIVCPLIVDESVYSYNKLALPAGYAIDTLAELQAHVETYENVLALPEDLFSTENDDWHRSEDYELWRYDKVEEALDYARGVVEGYPAAVERVEEANAALAAANASGNADEITAAQEELTAANEDLASYNATKYANAAYELEYYIGKAAEHQNFATTTHLEAVIYLAESKEYDEDDYSAEVWEQYEKAFDHAYEVYDMPDMDYSTGKALLKRSMVNYARKHLLDAMKLMEVALADTSELEAYYEQVKDTDTSSYSASSVKEFEDALANAEEYIGQLLTIDYQDEVDEALARLQAAYENLSAAEDVVVETIDKDVNVNDETNLIAGLDTLLDPDELLDSYIKASEGGRIEVTTVNGSAVVGTGTKVTLLTEAGDIVKEYEVVIYGDANGDGLVDLMDTLCLDLYTVYDANHNYADGSAQWTALNLNNDKKVDSSDVVILDGYANFESEINQQNPFAG